MAGLEEELANEGISYIGGTVRIGIAALNLLNSLTVYEHLTHITSTKEPRGQYA